MAKSNKLIYIGVAIPIETQVPMLFNESLSTDLKETALKTSQFLKQQNLNLDGDVKMSVIPVDQGLLDSMNKLMNK